VFCFLIVKDIKPANVLLHNGQVKLGDFGAAKLWYKSSDKKQSGNSMAGSPCYFAPEVINDTKEMGPKGAQDIWALGCLLYETVLGREPWDQLDNIWSLYYLIGVWAQRAREMKSELEDQSANAPFQMLRGCRVCDEFDSDDESSFSSSADEEDDEEEGVNCPVRTSERAKRLSREDHSIVLFGITDVNQVQNAKEISNPLLSIAVESGLFSEDALDFLNLTLQWTVCFVRCLIL
jgi:serine/threonine protein kinase